LYPFFGFCQPLDEYLYPVKHILILFMIDRIRRWQPENEIILVGDGGYAAVMLV
jgi:hypothetical protein